MAELNGRPNGDSKHVENELSKLSTNDVSLATLALHADDPLNIVDDVAPPMHVSTTFRYPDDPDALIPGADRSVCLLTINLHSRLALSLAARHKQQQ